jgi:UPF0755 protein
MWRSAASNALTLLVVALVAGAGALAWAQREWSRPGPLAEAICVSVEPGSTMRAVSEDLAERGAVSSDALFRVGTEYADLTGLLKAGAFRVPEGASMSEIAGIVTGSGASTCGSEIVRRVGVASTDTLVRALDPDTDRFAEVARFGTGDPLPAAYEAAAGDPATRFRIAVSEGATSWQVATALEEAAFLEGEVDAVPAEGSLAPDSYEVEPGTDRAEVLAEMQRRQEAILAEAWAARDSEAPLASAEEALILASIVEKETALAEERNLVAGVFANRLRDGMRLQTDPTVIYGITRGEGVLGRGLRRSELDAETPWNTYRIDGLPPTPIANPGREAILAAVRPAETDALFFVADGTGGHAFAETLEEHNANVARWREIEAEREAEAVGQ